MIDDLDFSDILSEPRNELRDAAIEYYYAGERVIPLEPKGKRPLVRWQEEAVQFENEPRIDDINRIVNWFDKWPDANIGLAALNDDVWFDFDGEQGMKALAELEQAYPEFQTAPRNITGKGVHVRFRMTDGMELSNSASKLADGVDVRAGGKGYVMAPPSIHPSGTRYRCVRTGERPAVPKPLYEALTASPLPSRDEPHQVQSLLGTSRYGDKALWEETTLVRAAPDGRRNNQLNISAMKVFNLVAGGHIAEDVALSELLTAALDAGLSESEAFATINSAARKGLERPRGETVEREKPSPPTSSLSFTVAESVQIEHRTSYWNGRLPTGYVTLLHGASGKGKSLMTCKIAAAFSKGTSIDGISSPVPKGKVLMINHEDDTAADIVPRLEANGADLSNVAIVNDNTFSLAHFDQLDQMISEHNFILVIMEPLETIAQNSGKAVNHGGDMRDIFNPLNAIARRHKIPIIMAHHDNKTQGSSSVSDKAAGSTQIIASVRSELAVAEDIENDQKILFHGKCNHSEKQQPLNYSIDGMRFTWEGENADTTMAEVLMPPERPTIRKKVEVEKWLDNYLQGVGSATSSEVYKAAREQIYAGRKSVDSAAKRLNITKVASGRGSDYRVVWYRNP